MMPSQLGRLERVRDLRSVWPNEATGFTPWLATDENIELLSDTIGIELEVQQQEAAVGPFRADILCRDIQTDRLVLVENQLERTDHTHLGQLFTYAAGLDAVTVVWIAQRFTEEHRAALDWLNRITHEDFRFFGIEIELWRIGESAIAPKFNLVAKPNDWAKTIREAAATGGTLNETQSFKKDFWTELKAYAEKRGSKIKVGTPAPRYYSSFGIGRSGFSLGASIRPVEYSTKGSANVYLWIDQDPDGRVINHLKSDRALIEDQIGHSLRWDVDHNRKSNWISLVLDNDAPDRKRWPDIHKWMLDTLESFDQAFRDRVRSMPTQFSVAASDADHPLV